MMHGEWRQEAHLHRLAPDDVICFRNVQRLHPAVLESINVIMLRLGRDRSPPRKKRKKEGDCLKDVNRV
jgi:hypothetical protein